VACLYALECPIVEDHAMRVTFLVAAFVLISTSVGTAAIVFDNGNHISNGLAASGSREIADNFILPGTNVTDITDVHWKGVYGNGVADETDDFEIRIYEDGGSGLPATAPGTAPYDQSVGSVSRIATGELSGGLPVYEYSTFISPFAAVGGTTYWLEIFNNATDDSWYWAADFNTGSLAFSDEGSWGRVSDEVTFQLTDDAVSTSTPEPSSFAIWSVLCIGGVAAKLRFKSNH
jgi:hypothetical protein